MHLDMAPSDRDNYLSASKAAVKDLLQSGFQVYGKYEVVSDYFGHKYKLTVASLHEVAPVMYQFLLRQVVVNTGQVPAMPWEEHLMAALGGSIPKMPETTKMDEDIIDSIRGGREIISQAIQDCTNYSTMAREVRLARDAVRAVDSYYYLEEDFFAQAVPGLVEQHIYDRVLSNLPGEQVDPLDASNVLGKGEAAYKEIAGVWACVMVRHSLPPVGKAVNGAMLILRPMLDGESLGGKAVKGSSEFHRSVYERCARFLIFDYNKVVTVNGKQVRYDCGSAAMVSHVREVDNAQKAGKQVDLIALKVFRQFRWLLTPEEDGRIHKLIVDERRKRQNFLEGHTIKDDETHGGENAKNVEDKEMSADAPLISLLHTKKSKKAEANSSSSSKAAPQPSEPPAKKAKGDTDTPDMDAWMAMFFPKWMHKKAEGV